MKKIIIIGGYGNGTVAASTIEDINGDKPAWEILGFLNDFETEPINGYPILGKIDPSSINQYLKYKDVLFLYTLISVKFNYNYLSKLTDLQIPQQKYARVIHPTAVVSKFANLGFGISIQPLVVVGPNVTINNHVQIFAQSLVGHNATLENYAYVANNACIGASVKLEEGAYLGTNCTTIENINIGKWSVVGMGSVVLKDVPEYTKVVGNPAREIGKT
ncbi:MAG: acetyltransferase [Candidatus Cyclobacteriaceae bacterium M3_2C_046]